MDQLRENDGKKVIIEADGVFYERLPIKTSLITEKDDIKDLLNIPIGYCATCFPPSVTKFFTSKLMFFLIDKKLMRK